MLYFLAYYKKRKRQRQNWLYIQDRWLVKPSMSLRHGSATTTKLPLSREYNEDSLVHDYTLSSSIVLKRSRFELDHVTFNKYHSPVTCGRRIGRCHICIAFDKYRPYPTNQDSKTFSFSHRRSSIRPTNHHVVSSITELRSDIFTELAIIACS